MPDESARHTRTDKQTEGEREADGRFAETQREQQVLRKIGQTTRT